MHHLPLCQIRFTYGIDHLDDAIQTAINHYFSTLLKDEPKDIDRIGFVDFLRDWMKAMLRHYTRHERLHTETYAEYHTDTTLPGMHISAHLVILPDSSNINV